MDPLEKAVDRAAGLKRHFDLAQRVERAEAEIERLADAIWEFGEHRKSCRIDSGKECDCGFFEIIKSLPPEQNN